MSSWRISWLLLLTSTAYADPVKIVIIDTGLDLTDSRVSSHLCPSGHKDFTGTGIEDNHGHGTHVAGLIIQHAKKANYCLIILKYSDPSIKPSSPARMVLAEREAVRLGAKIVNISSGGPQYSEEEDLVITSAKNILFVVAAGNNGQDIATHKYYPASLRHKNMRVVGNLNQYGNRNPSSNYGGLVDSWEVGTNVRSLLPNFMMGNMTGTSMSTAIKTGKLIYEKYSQSN